jgi:hypothetical protein
LLAFAPFGGPFLAFGDKPRRRRAAEGGWHICASTGALPIDIIGMSLVNWHICASKVPLDRRMAHANDLGDGAHARASVPRIVPSFSCSQIRKQARCASVIAICNLAGSITVGSTPRL